MIWGLTFTDFIRAFDDLSALGIPFDYWKAAANLFFALLLTLYAVRARLRLEELSRRLDQHRESLQELRGGFRHVFWRFYWHR